MNETPGEPQQEPPEQTNADALGEQEAPEFTEDDKPGATDFLKAAKDAAKNLKKQEP